MPGFSFFFLFLCACGSSDLLLGEFSLGAAFHGHDLIHQVEAFESVARIVDVTLVELVEVIFDVGACQCCSAEEDGVVGGAG